MHVCMKFWRAFLRHFPRNPAVAYARFVKEIFVASKQHRSLRIKFISDLRRQILRTHATFAFGDVLVNNCLLFFLASFLKKLPKVVIQAIDPLFPLFLRLHSQMLQNCMVQHPAIRHVEFAQLAQVRKFRTFTSIKLCTSGSRYSLSIARNFEMRIEHFQTRLGRITR